MGIPFVKMHGLGNDFVVIDARSGAAAGIFAEEDRATETARRLADRRFGIGADQVLLLHDSDVADVKMEIYNADGGRVEMCGNGIRCFARYVWERGIADRNPLSVETLAGIIRPERAGDQVRVDMGRPVLDAPDIPVALEGRVVDHPLDVGGEPVRVTCVSMGNPHAVVFVESVDDAPVGILGPRVELHPLFPNRINVEFVQVTGEAELRMRVWERGTGETLACGTGACAAAVAGVLREVSGRDVAVHLPGGVLRVEWDEGSDTVFMTGPAEQVFEGTVSVRD